MSKQPGELMLQYATSNKGQRGGRKLLCAFAEHGAILGIGWRLQH